MIVDTAVHAWELSSDKYPWKPLGKITPDFAWPIERHVPAMDEAGVDKGLLVQTSFYGYDNRYVLDVFHGYPGRFALICIVDPSSKTLEKDMEALVQQGASGFRLAQMLRPDIDWYNERLWRKAGEMGAKLTLLIGPNQLDEVAQAVERYPQVTCVIDHLAQPQREEDPAHPAMDKLMEMAKYPNLYVKVSAMHVLSKEPWPHRDMQALLFRAMDAYGARRCMWGTDYAMSSRGSYPLKRLVELIDLQLEGRSAQEAALVKGDAAADLFGLK